ncbi:hypothetical protein PENSPDRAFT_691877 [Peniophora sp. CONT]|nr:hypothetical protein PENSPDRAFT_691877 [Peniophora sp. CONT]
MFLVHFASSDVLGSIRDAMICHWPIVGDGVGCISLLYALHIYHKVATTTPVARGRAPLIRRYDIIGLLARAILSANANFDHPFPERVREYIDDYAAFSRLLRERHSKENVPVLKALTDSAQNCWYITLMQLRAMQTDDPVMHWEQGALERSWQTFGEILGLNEETEHQRDSKQFCAWRECQYHEAKSPKPTTACKGCGAVRYCGKICQAKAWKDGHKQVCKRIKNEAHAPKE